jgi:hypothetical protein
VAWGKENFVRKDWAKNQAEQEIKKRRKETAEMSQMQQLPKECIPESSVTRPKHMSAIASWNREDVK